MDIMDIMGYETCFAWISNELNNLPLCLGSKYRDLGSLDLLTPNWLIHVRANRRAMVGPCTIEYPTCTLEKMEDIFQAWWNAWYNEKLADFVAKPPKWYRSGPVIPSRCVPKEARGAKARQSHLVGRPCRPDGAFDN